ncbi:MAG: nucleotidyltransferase domain-containing protein [Chloroflexi bacterium]|nr:nucleotidyltransferase domain-containing protein [Chloroflexota bacterium]
MNDASQWRYRIAQRIGELYARNADVPAVILGGSTARGHADRFSDLDMGVIWDHEPSDSERHQVVRDADAELHRLYRFDPAEQVWSDDYFIHRNQPDGTDSKLLVEVSHYKRDFVEDVLHQVLNEHATNVLWHNLISGIVDGFSLYGDDVITSWRNRATQYPRELSVAIVQKYGVIDHFWRWEMYLARGDNLALFYDAFTQIHQRLLHILLGLNKMYYFGFKWIEVIDERLSIKPDDLPMRIRSAYKSAPAEGAAHVSGLVDDVFGLIETHLPEVDTNRLRRIFHYTRPSV